MAERRAKGIITRIGPLTESSLIVQWFTLEMGRISTVAKGARRRKSPFHGNLDMFYSAEVLIGCSRRSELHGLHEIRLSKTREPLRHSIAALRRAAYATRLLEQTTETDTPAPELYLLFESFLDAVTADPGDPLLVLALELRLLDRSGLAPDTKTVEVSPGVRLFVGHLRNDSWDALGRLRPSPGQQRELRQLNASLLLRHLDYLPPSRDLALKTETDELKL